MACLAAVLALGAISAACQPQPGTGPEANANANANAPAANANTTTLGVNPNAVINVREPERYSATYVLKADTPGNAIGGFIPQISADVSRNGGDHRIAVKLPTGEDVIFLDKTDKRYVIQPAKKQYAELTQETTGFEVQRVMTPGQLVSYLEKQRGYERVGDDTVNGRPAEKFRYAATAATGTQAGDVKNESFVFVDKATGLPLRADLNFDLTGNVQGIKSLRIVAEMRDIKTDVDPATFEVPQGYRKATPEEVRQQIDAIARFAALFASQFLANAATSGSPAAGASPSMSPGLPAAGSPSPGGSISPSPR